MRDATVQSSFKGDAPLQGIKDTIGACCQRTETFMAE